MKDKTLVDDFDDPEFISQLLALCHTEHVELTADQAQLCQRHVQLMLLWNRRTNLTRITQPEAIVFKHLLDSLLPVRWLPRRGRAIDVGSGAGFPGVPLKILCPDLDMVLLESHGKKVSFLKMLSAELGLEHLTVLQSRWEDLVARSGPAAPASAALITMRAVKPRWELFTTFAAQTLEPGGILAYWSGPKSPESAAQTAEPTLDLASLSGGKLELVGCHEYQLPQGYGTRRLLRWRRHR